LSDNSQQDEQFQADYRTWYWAIPTNTRRQLDQTTAQLEQYQLWHANPPLARSESEQRKQLRVANNYGVTGLARAIGSRRDRIRSWEVVGKHPGPTTHDEAQSLYANLAASLYADHMVTLLATLYKIDHFYNNDLPSITNPDYITWLDGHVEKHPHIVIKEIPMTLAVIRPWPPAPSARTKVA